MKHKKGFLFGLIVLVVIFLLITFSYVSYQYFSNNDRWDDFNAEVDAAIEDVKNSTDNLFNQTKESSVTVDMKKNSTVTYEFVDFYGQEHDVDIVLYDDYVDYYKNRHDVNLYHDKDEFYPSFFEDDAGDAIFYELINISAANTDNDRDQLLFLMALVGSIEYKYVEEFYYPYEILNLNYGACTDKAFLMVELLDRLGYGVALLHFPDNEHMTAGIKCDQGQYDEYCILDTTKGKVFIGDNEMEYSFTGKLTDNYDVIEIADGKSYDASMDFEMIEAFDELRAALDEQDAILADVNSDRDYIMDTAMYCSGAKQDVDNNVRIRIEYLYNGGKEMDCDDIIELYNSFVEINNQAFAKQNEIYETYGHMINYIG